MKQVNNERLLIGGLIVMMSVISIYVAITIAFINGVAIGIVCTIGIFLILGVRKFVNDCDLTQQSNPSVMGDKHE